MRTYTKRAQVLLTDAQHRHLSTIARQQGKPLGALLRDAAEELYLKKKRAEEKAEAVRALLALPEVEAPADYQEWERQYLDEKSSPGSG